MEKFDLFNQKLELLKMARELLNDEYLNRRAEQHNKWLVVDDKMKRTHGINVPYPEFVPFPSEKAIIKKARALYEFIDQDADLMPDSEVRPTIESIPDLLPDLLPDLIYEPIPEPIPEPVVESDTVPEHVAESEPVSDPTSVHEPIPEPVVEPDTESTIVSALDLVKIAEQKLEMAQSRPIDPYPLPKRDYLPGWVRRQIS